jgi:hypothetical protein
VASAHASDLLVIAPELGDRAKNDRIHAEDAANFCGARGIGAVAVRKILFGNNLVQRGAFDDGIFPVLHELLDHQVGDPFAHVLVRAKDGSDDGLDRAVIEIHHGHALLWARRLSLRRRGGLRR